MPYKNYQYIDLTYISELADGDAVFISDMIKLFNEHTPEEIEKLEEAIGNKDWVNARSISHKMKSSINHVGIKELIPILQEIEKSAASLENLDKIQFKFESLKSVCFLAYSELEQEFRALNKKS